MPSSLAEYTAVTIGYRISFFLITVLKYLIYNYPIRFQIRNFASHVNEVKEYISQL